MTLNSNLPPIGKSGRPVEFVREAAVESAMNLFWKKGFLSVSAKDLADAMGIQRSSFYNSFGKREAVFLEALSLYSTLTPDRPLHQVLPGQAVVPVVVSVMRNICHIRATDVEARGCMVCNGIAELVGVEESLGPLLESGVKRMTVVVENLLCQAVQQGEITLPENTGTVAETFVAFLIGLNTISKIVRNEKQLWAMCAQFLRGLGLPEEALEPTSQVSSANKKRGG